MSTKSQEGEEFPSNNNNKQIRVSEKFSGKEDSITSTRFLKLVEIQFNLKNITNDKDQICCVSEHLIDDASTWFIDWIEDKDLDTATYAEFSENLIAHFGKNADPIKICTQITELNNEKLNLEEYNTKFNSLVSKLPQQFWSEQAKVTYYIMGLSTDLFGVINRSQPATLKEAQSLASRSNKTLDSKSGVIKEEPVLQIDAIHQSRNNSYNSYKRRREDNNDTCYYCHQYGHIARQCQQNPANRRGGFKHFPDRQTKNRSSSNH